jgi:hypothetical protein
MSMQLNSLIAAGADPELRFLSPAERIHRLTSADQDLAPLLDPLPPVAPLVCLIFPVKENEPTEQPAREGEEPVEPTTPDQPSDTRH